jgi:hypothetical protein
MIRGKIQGKIREYVLKEDRGNPAEEQTVFLYQLLKADDAWNIQDGVMEHIVPQGGKDADVRTIVHNGRSQKAALLRGLVGVRNMQDEDGNPVVFTTPKDKAGQMQVIDMLDNKQRVELANAILGDADLTPAEKGNSLSQSGPLSSEAKTADTETPQPVAAA